jgi:multidrug efflux pump subunit AcrA (membrane-fusion protein)
MGHSCRTISCRGATGALLLALLAPAGAHEGEPHGPAAAPAPAATLAPRAEASTPDLELLAVAEDEGLTLYLDRYASNEPVAGARVEVHSLRQELAADERDPGVYRARAGWLAAPGRHELIVSVEGPDLADVLPLTLTVPPPAPAPPAGGSRTYGYAGAALAAVLLVLAVGLRRRRGRAALVLMLLATHLPAPAHEGHQHGAPIPPAPAGAAASRTGEGHLLVPKPTQRLLGVRTVVGELAELPGTLALNGRVIPDPNASGRVQAAMAGRVDPPESGLPHLGQRVEKGQVLALILPVVSGPERGQLEASLADLSSQIDLGERRATRLGALQGSVPQREVEAARLEVQGLRERLAALERGLTRHDTLRAPVAGVVSRAAAAAGQLVAPGEVLFELVDPERLWVEAVAYDAGEAAQVVGATAVSAAGRALTLTLLGYGHQLQEQALPLQFRIEPPLPPLSVGEPVRVLARTSRIERGVRLPAEGVVRDEGGSESVWLHTGAERFEARRVRTRPADAGHLLVTEGLAGGERVVVAGAAALAQVR